MRSKEVIAEVVRGNANISSICLHKFSFDGDIQSRVGEFSSLEKEALGRAIELKFQKGIRFWDAFFDVCVNEGLPSERALQWGLHHNENRDFVRVGRERIVSGIESLSGDYALCSRIEAFDGRDLHIPLLDFKAKVSLQNSSLIAKVVKVLGLRGYVLSSGNSYHFIGRDLIGTDELVALLAKFILLHPISDKAWAAHQIIERCASLRVTKKRGLEPEFLGMVE
jgi:hypothetical protein